MRRITLALVSTVAALVLLFSYRTSLGGSLPGSAPAAAAPGVVPDPTTPVAGRGAAPQGPRASAAPRPEAVTATGAVAQTRWGPVQVRVRIVGARITDVTVLRHPSGNSQDEQINSFALPRLRAEVLRAQSARIDTVSGATVTSDGYLTSLQSALDAAHFG
jgi:uncharacterized protein with FMN-binding domain